MGGAAYVSRGWGVAVVREVNCIKALLPAVKFLGYIKRSTRSLAKALFFISSPFSPPCTHKCSPLL